MPRYRGRRFRGDKEIQGFGRVVAYEEDDDAVGEDPKADESQQHRGVEIGLPEEGHRLPGFRVPVEQPAGSAIESAGRS